MAGTGRQRPVKLLCRFDKFQTLAEIHPCPQRAMAEVSTPMIEAGPLETGTVDGPGGSLLAHAPNQTLPGRASRLLSSTRSSSGMHESARTDLHGGSGETRFPTVTNHARDSSCIRDFQFPIRKTATRDMEIAPSNPCNSMPMQFRQRHCADARHGIVPRFL